MAVLDFFKSGDITKPSKEMIREKIKRIKPFLFPCEENNYRPTLLDGRFLLYVTLILAMLKFVGLFSFTQIPRTPYFADISRGALVQMANQERVLAGLHPLNESPELLKAAELKAQDMLLRDYFSHWSPGGVSPWHWFNVAGYDYRYAGENLAIGFFNAKDVHKAWTASPSHRDNILGADYNDIGVAVVEGDFYGQRTFLVVQVFGSRNIYRTTLAPVPLEELNNETLGKYRSEADAPSVLGVGPTIAARETTGLEGTKRSILSFLVLEYDEMLGQLILSIMLFIGFVMVTNVFVRFDVQHPDLIFKGLGFLLLFFVFDQFDQMTLIKIMTDGPWIG